MRIEFRNLSTGVQNVDIKGGGHHFGHEEKFWCHRVSSYYV